MDADLREHYRRLLLGRRALLMRRRERMRHGDLGKSAGDSISELSTYDNHPADLGTETWKRAQELGLRALWGEGLTTVEQALERLDAGTYGVCVRCGRAVEPARLEVVPETPFCKQCRERLAEEDRAGGSERPVEEDVLGVPFAPRGDATAHTGGLAGFDGEDVWQAVARYGTSETPSDVPEAHHYPVVPDPDEPRGVVAPVEEKVDEEGEPLDS